MPDPITSFGAAAGVVQIADVALRASREAYAFLIELKHAKRDIQDLKNALRDAESNVRSLRSYLYSFSKSKGAIEEFDILPEVVTSSIHLFHDDIVQLKSILPRKPTPSLAQKIKWVYNHKSVEEISKRLHERKSSLSVALSVVGRLNDLRIRDDVTKLKATVESETRAIKHDQALAMNAIASQASHLSSQMKTQSDHQGQCSQQASKTSSTVQSIEAQLHRHDQANTKISEQLTSLVNRHSVQANQHEQYYSRVQQSTDELRTSQSTSLHKLSEVRVSVDAVSNQLSEMKSTTVLSASNPDVLTKIFRAELQSSLKSALENALSQSNMRQDATMSRMETMIDRMSLELGQWSTNNNESAHVDHLRYNNTDSHDNDIHGSMAGRFSSVAPPRTHNLTPLSPNEPTVSHTTCTLRRHWCFKWRIGKIVIMAEQKIVRDWNNDTRNSSFAIFVHFRPSQKLMPLPALSLHYDSAPDERGFYQMTPAISVIPILPLDHIVWKIIRDGNLSKLKEMISYGAIDPRSEDFHGGSLNYMAALSTQPHILNYLFSLGIGVSCSRDQLYGIIPGTMLSFLALFPMINPFRGGSFELILSIIGERVESISDCYDGMIDSLDNNNTTLDYPIWSAEIPMRYLQYSQERIKNPWRVLFFQYGYRLFQPTSTVRRFWQLALCDGLIDPDYSIFGMHHAPLLQRALYGMVQITDRGRIANDEQQYDEEQYEDNLCIVKLLILAGANIYHMHPASVENAQHWKDIRTHTKYAIHFGIWKQWEQALSECGLDIGEFHAEDKRLCKQELRLRGARRSGVDESVLELPSRNGIRCRRCQKKHCLHGFE